MNVLVKKMSSLGILKFQMIAGAIVMIAVVILLPGSIIANDPSLILDPYLLGVVLIGMLMFGLFAYFLFIRPYFEYNKSPEVLAETDGEYVYLYGKKTAKIPLADFEGSVVTYDLPFVYSSELMAVLVVHLCSEEYGDLSLDVPGYGCYKLRFVADVRRTADNLTAFLCNANFNIDL